MYYVLLYHMNEHVLSLESQLAYSLLLLNSPAVSNSSSMSHRGRRWKSTPSRWGSSSGRPPRRSNQGQQIALNTSTFTPDAVIERVSWRPAYILDAMISIPDELPKPTILARTPTSFSLGLLDTLPIELLYNILNSSDFQSLSRFARVSHGAKILVESL